MSARDTYDGACHCGAVTFRVRLSGGLNAAHRCNCSFCRMRGAVVLTARSADFELVTGVDALTLYQFNTMSAEHHFCKHCGIYTHHRRRLDPNEFGINAACLAGMSPFDFAQLPVADGINHPSDSGEHRVVGILGFAPRD